jgi:hypothetical protein
MTSAILSSKHLPMTLKLNLKRLGDSCSGQGRRGLQVQRALRSAACDHLLQGLKGHVRMKRKLRASRETNVAAALQILNGENDDRDRAYGGVRTPHCVRWETPIGVCATWGLDPATLANMRARIEACLGWLEPCPKRPPYYPWSHSRNWPHITTPSPLGEAVPCVACHKMLPFAKERPIALSMIAPVISAEHGPVVLELVRQIAGEPAIIEREGGWDYAWTNLKKLFK